MSTSMRGWVLGLGLGLGGAVLSCALHFQAQREQAQRWEELRTELATLRRAMESRQAEGSPEHGLQRRAAGIPPALARGEARLTPEDLEALARHLAVLLRQEGAVPGAAARAEAPPPAAPPPLNSEQQQALARANTLVDRALSVGRMTPEDLREFRRELTSIASSAEIEKLRLRLIVALNRDQLVLPEGTNAPP